MSQNIFKRFKPNPAVDPPRHQPHQMEQRFKRAHENDGQEGSGPKRRVHDYQRQHWSSQQQHQQHQQQQQFYQPPAEEESLLKEW